MDGEALLFSSPLGTGAGVSGTHAPTEACSQARGAATAIWSPIAENLTKERQTWQEGLQLACLPVAHGRLNLRFKDRPPTGPLSFSFTAVCHYDHYYYTHMSQLLGGDVRMFQMAACLAKIRYE